MQRGHPLNDLVRISCPGSLLVRMETILKDRVGDEDCSALPRNAKPEFPVLGEGLVLDEPTDAARNLGTQQSPPLRRVPAEKRVTPDHAFGLTAHMTHPAPVTDSVGQDIATDGSNRTWMPIERGHQHFERTREQPIVVVQEQDVASSRDRESTIAGAGSFGVMLEPHQAHALVWMLRDPFSGSVVRIVINDDELPPFDRLAFDGRNRFAEKSESVARRYYDRDVGHASRPVV